MDFKHSFITLIAWQILVVAIILDPHPALSKEVYFILKLFEMVVLLFVPILIWEKIEALGEQEEGLL